MKVKFIHFVVIAATLLAACAAYYSVFGLSQLFAGASLAVIIMASSLEVSKIVTVSLLQRYWTKLSRLMKTYLTIGAIILISVTSAGIYGFLSNAYQKTATQYNISQSEVSLLEIKKDQFTKTINDNKTLIENKTKRLDQLSTLRSTQETRLDNATNNSSRNNARKDIDQSNKEIQRLNTEIDTLNAKNLVLNDSLNNYSTQILTLSGKNATTSELGPLKYISDLTKTPMDKVVNYFILLLIFVFDPLAVALVVAANKISLMEESETQQKMVVEPDMIPHTEESNNVLIQDDLSDIDNTSDSYDDTPIEQEILEENKTEIKENQDIKKDEAKEIEDEKNKQITLKDIKEIKEQQNRGFSVPIYKSKTNTIQRVGSNKYLDNDKNIVFKRSNK